MRRILIIISCIAVTIPAAQADDKEKTLYAAAPTTTSQWHQTSLGMQPLDYRNSTKQNQRIVQQDLAKWANRQLADNRSYAPALGLLGATIDLAVNDRRYHFNEARTMGLLIRDSARSNRALLLEYRKSW
jgi:hypothetical protein